MNSRGLLVLCLTITACTTGYTQDPGKTKMNSDATPPEKPKSPPPSPIAVTSAESGKVMLLDRGDLSLIRTVEPDKPGSSSGPMLVAEDKVRRVFYVGNFNGGLGRIPMDGSKPSSLDLGGVLIGVAISPDGRLLAVNGAHDLTLRFVDLDTWKMATSYRFGTPTDTPIHSPLTHGMASTHPVWLRDGSGVLVQDNIHEEVVLIGRDGKEIARRKLRTAAHTFLTTSTGEILALVEGTIDGKNFPASSYWTGRRSRSFVRLPCRWPPANRQNCITARSRRTAKSSSSPTWDRCTAMNFGTTVAALQWRTGKVLWNVPTVRNAGHVRFLDADRVIVLGHRDANLAVLDVKTGQAESDVESSGGNLAGTFPGRRVRWYGPGDRQQRRAARACGERRHQEPVARPRQRSS